MDAIPSFTSISVGDTNYFYGNKIQTTATTSVVDPQTTSNSVVVDIYDGDTAANQAALTSYLGSIGYKPPADAATAPAATIATIQNGSAPIQIAAESYTHYSSGPHEEGLEIDGWTATGGDGTYLSATSISASPAYAISFDRNDDGSESVTVTNPDGSTVTGAAGATSIKDGTLTITLSVAASGSAIDASFTVVNDSADSSTVEATIAYGSDVAALAAPPPPSPSAPPSSSPPASSAAPPSSASPPPAATAPPVVASTSEIGTVKISNAVPFVPAASTPLVSASASFARTATVTRDADGNLSLSLISLSSKGADYQIAGDGTDGNGESTLIAARITYGRALAVAPGGDIDVSG